MMFILIWQSFKDPPQHLSHLGIFRGFLVVSRITRVAKIAKIATLLTFLTKRVPAGIGGINWVLKAFQKKTLFILRFKTCIAKIWTNFM